MKVGDLVSIWDGEGDVYDPKSWPFGVVVREGLDFIGRWQYQVHWENDAFDMTWYAASDLDIKKRPQQRTFGDLNESR